MADPKKAELSTEVQKWTSAIAAYNKAFSTWEKRTEKIVKRYRDDRITSGSNNQRARFNILWSNVQTLIPAVFSRLPRPDVSRRFKDNDPVGRVAALILERALSYELEHYGDYRYACKAAVQDRFLGGRGTSWVRYEPRFKQAEMPDGAQVTSNADDNDELETDEVLDYECAPVDYVYWKDFGHTLARTWEEVTAVWRRVYMPRAELVERFGEELGNKIPLDAKPNEYVKKNSAQDEAFNRAAIFEIWDKENGCALWISKSHADVLDKRQVGKADEDLCEFDDFFPCPRPLFGTLTNDTLEPIPDFCVYQDQANELDIISDRIDGLVKAMQVKGCYDASIPELSRLFTEGENTTLIPIKNYAALAEKGGLMGGIELVDLTPIANALKELYAAQEQIKQQVYEIYGVSDIVRGATDPNETLGAQEMKGQYANLRLRHMQDEVAQFCTSNIRLKAQTICQKFEAETIAKIGGADQLSDADKEYIGPAIALLKSGTLRDMRIDIESDSLVQIDENAEKQARSEFLQAVGGYLKEALPVIQAAPEAGGLVIEMLKFGVTGFKVGKQLEGTIDQALDQLKQAAMQTKQPPPDPAMEKVKAQAAADQQKMQADVMMERQRLQMEAQFEQQRNQMEAQRAAQENAMEDARAKQQMMFDAQMARFEALLKAKTAVEVAEIGAQATIDSAQISGAEQAVQ